MFCVLFLSKERGEILILGEKSFVRFTYFKRVSRFHVIELKNTNAIRFLYPSMIQAKSCNRHYH